MKKLIILLLIASSAAFGQVPFSLFPLPTTKKPAQVYGYVDHVPGKGKYPLLIALDGYGQNGKTKDGNKTLTDLIKTGIGKLIADNKLPIDSFIIILPQNRNGNQRYSIPELTNFLAYIKANYNIDTTRIYMTGFSGGANSLYSWLQTNKCTAAITVCGSGSRKDVCTTIGHTPLWAFHSYNDDTVPIGGDILLQKAYNKCGQVEPMQLTIYSAAGHGIWDQTYANPEIYKWLLKHKSVN